MYVSPKKCLFECAQEPLTFYRLREENFTKKNREIETNELQNWLENIKSHASFLSKKEIETLSELILYKKTTLLILENKILKSIFHILKFPNSFKKIKLFLLLLIPRSILEKKKEF